MQEKETKKIKNTLNEINYELLDEVEKKFYLDKLEKITRFN